MRKRYIYIILIISLFIWTCEDTTDEVDTEYPVALEQGMDVNRISRAFAQFDRVITFRGIVLGKNGEIAAEHYYLGTDKDELHDVRSVTKSVMSILTGIAIEEGHLESKDQTLDELMSRAIAELPDTSVGSITLADILRMSSGLEWHELDGGNSYFQWYQSDNHIQWVLTQDWIHEPGSGFNYNTGSIHLLSSIISAKTHKPVLEYAQEKLFDPLEGESDWTILPPNDGYLNNGGAGLQISLETMFRLGSMMIDNGQWNGQQLVPADWVQQSTSIQNTTGSANPYYSSYGYLWWIGKKDDVEFYLASGYGGQFILCAPELDFVAVTTANWLGFDWDSAGDHWYKILTILLDTIIPAVG